MSSNSSSIVISFSIAILLLLVLLLLVSYNSKCKMDNIERFENDKLPHTPDVNMYLQNPLISNPSVSSPAVVANNNIDVSKASEGAFEGYPVKASDTQNESYAHVSQDVTEGFANNDENTCFLRDRLTSADLLPKDGANSKWTQINPAGSGDMRDQNFLTAGYHIGINTIGQSLRNANLQLRSEPPNPQIAVSPWGISTIEPDIRQVAFEIGSAPSY